LRDTFTKYHKSVAASEVLNSQSWETSKINKKKDLEQIKEEDSEPNLPSYSQVIEEIQLAKDKKEEIDEIK
jgi:hypothetical protein